MKRLILMRHAKAALPRGGDGDFNRPLAERGRLAAPRAGLWLKAQGLIAGRVLVSAAVRTRETHALVAESAPELPRAEFDRDLYLASAERILQFIRATPPRMETVMVIGHNPGLADLALDLADHQASDMQAVMRAARKFPTAAIAVFDVLTPWSETGSQDCAMTTFVTPADLGGIDED